LITVVGEISSITQLDSICIALVELAEKCSVRVMFSAPEAVVLYVERNLVDKASGIEFSVLLPNHENTIGINNIVEDDNYLYRIFVGNGVLPDSEVFLKLVDTALTKNDASFVYSDHDSIRVIA